MKNGLFNQNAFPANVMFSRPRLHLSSPAFLASLVCVTCKRCQSDSDGSITIEAIKSGVGADGISWVGPMRISVSKTATDCEWQKHEK